MIGKYWKSITAFVVGVLGWVGIVLASDAADITNEEWGQLIAVIIATVGVFLVPNTPAEE